MLSVLLNNIITIVADLPRHSSFRYINKGSLTPSYFKAAYNSLSDPNIYIIISNTGSAVSEFISIFTKNQYNHASLSFDADLKTLLSYNGGENPFQPGLNPEEIENFHKKPNASAIVYRLESTYAQKKLMLEKIREINEQGSAYNIIGLMLKCSFKPNILFCSQFVYKMLKHAGLQYFSKHDADVRPIDFLELDTQKKMHFSYNIFFTHNT